MQNTKSENKAEREVGCLATHKKLWNFAKKKKAETSILFLATVVRFGSSARSRTNPFQDATEANISPPRYQPSG